MLHHITWDQYLNTILLAAVIYYVVIIFRYYRPELHQLVSRFNGDKTENHLPDALRYEEAGITPAHQKAENNQAENEPYETLTDADHLNGQLKACISIAADKPFAPAVLIPQIKKILQGHPELAGSPERPAINELIVQECEKTGTALLTEDEVDQWWGD